MMKTVVEILMPVINEAGEYLDVEGKPMERNKIIHGKSVIPEQQFSKELYYLLHWGLETNFTYDDKGNSIPYSSTVGICQHIKTGHIQTFHPAVIRVIGMEQKK